MRYTKEIRQFYADFLGIECPAEEPDTFSSLNEGIEEWKSMLNHFSDLERVEKRKRMPDLAVIARYEGEISDCKKHVEELKGRKNELKEQLTA